MSDEITVHHKVVRVPMGFTTTSGGKRGKGRIKSTKSLGGGGDFLGRDFLEFKRKGRNSLSPQPLNTYGHGRQAILRAFAEAKKTLEQHLWETK